MAYNLFIAYDLNTIGQNYEGVRSRIKALGSWHQFQFSLFYVHTELTPAAAFDFVRAVMDGNDRLAVINASGGIVTTWDKPPMDAINAIWAAPHGPVPSPAITPNWLTHVRDPSWGFAFLRPCPSWAWAGC